MQLLVPSPLPPLPSHVDINERPFKVSGFRVSFRVVILWVIVSGNRCF